MYVDTFQAVQVTINQLYTGNKKGFLVNGNRGKLRKLDRVIKY